MFEWIYELSGRAVDADGLPFGPSPLCVVDRTGWRDALVAMGSTTPSGEFRLSFTTSAFQQGAPPPRLRPRLTLIFSTSVGGAARPIARVQVPPEGFRPFTLQMGDVPLPVRDGKPLALLEGEAAPSPLDRARNLRLTGPIAAHALGEAASLVEAATGYPRLLDGLRLEIVDALEGEGPTGVRMGRGKGPLSSVVRGALLSLFHAGASGMYHHGRRAVIIHRPVAERNNLDNLMLVLGHELVHAGQYRAHPELSGEEHLRSLSPERRLAASANLEGYAYHVEHQLLRARFPLGQDLPSPEPGLVSGALAWGLRRLAPSRPMQAYEVDMDHRWRLIRAAEEVYRARQAEGGTVPFDPTVADRLV